MRKVRLLTLNFSYDEVNDADVPRGGPAVDDSSYVLQISGGHGIAIASA